MAGGIGDFIITFFPFLLRTGQVFHLWRAIYPHRVDDLRQFPRLYLSQFFVVAKVEGWFLASISEKIFWYGRSFFYEK